MTSYCLNQWWFIYYASLGLNELSAESVWNYFEGHFELNGDGSPYVIIHCVPAWRLLMQWPSAYINTLKMRQSDRHFADNVFKCISLNENLRNVIQVSLKFVRKIRNRNKPVLVQISGLAPIRRQCIIWTNDGLVHWRIYASLDLDEFTLMFESTRCMMMPRGPSVTKNRYINLFNNAASCKRHPHHNIVHSIKKIKLLCSPMTTFRHYNAQVTSM